MHSDFVMKNDLFRHAVRRESSVSGTRCMLFVCCDSYWLAVQNFAVTAISGRVSLSFKHHCFTDSNDTAIHLDRFANLVDSSIQCFAGPVNEFDVIDQVKRQTTRHGLSMVAKKRE